MGNKTTVTPSEIRGWGNVIGEKSTSDYGLYDASLTSTTATVDSRSRTVFTLHSLSNSTVLSLAAVGDIIPIGSTPSLMGYLKDSENNGLSGKSVKIYRGTTLLSTVTTGSGGAFSYTGSATSSTGTLTYHAVFEGDGDYGGSTSSDVTITVIKKITSLAIDVPLVLVYSDAFNITGTLKDVNNNLLNGKTVDLYVGSSKVDSGTTNSSGVVQFTQTPVHMGNHTFQLKFAGDSTYANVDSETVTRSIGKETSVLSLSAPVNNSSVYTGESVSVAGTLTDNDGVAMPSKTIVVSENGTTITTITTNPNGSFTGSLSGLSVATHSLKFEFVSDDYFTGSSVTRSVTVADHSYVLTASASSTSIAEGQSVTVSGVLTKDGVGYGSQTVTLHVVPSVGGPSTSTTTTASDGSYSFTLSSLTSSDGPYTVYATALSGDVESSDIVISVSSVAPSSLSVTGTKSILSYADSESSTLTATVLDSSSNPLSGQTVVFKKGSTTLDTKTTDSNGQCTYTYNSAGVGDVTITVECSLLQETYELEDCLRYDPTTSDKTSSYGALTTYRGSGTTTWTYSSGNGYIISIANSTEGMVTLSEINGSDDIIVEFDVQMRNFNPNSPSSAIGLCAYENNNNYSRISITNLKTAQRISVNGSANENETNLSNSIDSTQLVHLKYTISNNQIVEEVSQGSTVNGTRTISYTPNSNTKYGICGIWQKTWAENNYFKNIKVKAL